VIKTFRSTDTEALFHDRPVARLRAIERPARRKLLYLNQARSLQDLLVPPGNRLEALKADRRVGCTATGVVIEFVHLDFGARLEDHVGFFDVLARDDHGICTFKAQKNVLGAAADCENFHK
jgi:hypothetical protein